MPIVGIGCFKKTFFGDWLSLSRIAFFAGTVALPEGPFAGLEFYEIARPYFSGKGAVRPVKPE